MNWREKQNICFEMIKAKNWPLVICSKEEDYKGVDCIVNGNTLVDVKGEATLQKFPDTILISVGWSKDKINWHLPKYLERNDIEVWVCDIVGKNDIFCISANMLDKYRNGEYDFIKDKSMDYFGRYHKMVIIPKSECRKVLTRRVIISK